jgi:hypothetical protein
MLIYTPGDLAANSSMFFLLASKHSKDLFQFLNKPETGFKIAILREKLTI